MRKPLPVRGFRWMEETKNNWKTISDQDGTGYILEINSGYPKELHNLHNDYPLAPESIIPEGSKVQKLISNLNDKAKYIIHYENLKLYESLGLKITKIHRGIRFEEEAWLKKYIDLNTELRTKADNDFEKDFFKLMNNGVFGKTMENIENRVDVRLVMSKNELLKLSALPNYDRCMIFDENVAVTHMKRIKLTYSKLIYSGTCILDWSKTLMYEFHYNYIKNKYRDRAKLLFTDTDNLVYEIQTEVFYADIADNIKKLFNTSEHLKDHPSGIKTRVNKEVLSMFKYETAGKQIKEFARLTAKLYLYKMFVGDEHKKCKGVKENVVKKSITTIKRHSVVRNSTER